MEISNKTKIILSVVLIIALIIGFAIYTMVNNNKNSELTIADMLVSNEADVNENQAKDNAVDVNNENLQEETEKIAVHIIGEVNKPGIIYFEEGARINDAIEEAGGETKEADLAQVNLAYVLQDGQKIYIPNKKEKITTYIIQESGNNGVVEENSNTNESKEENEKVNINTASQSELDGLPGIGDSIAQRIIDYREQNGNFKSIEELKEVKGIGEAKFEEIKDRVTI